SGSRANRPDRKIVIIAERLLAGREKDHEEKRSNSGKSSRRASTSDGRQPQRRQQGREGDPPARRRTFAAHEPSEKTQGIGTKRLPDLKEHDSIEKCAGAP